MFNRELLEELQYYVDTHLQPVFHEMKLYSSEERMIASFHEKLVASECQHNAAIPLIALD